ncbi:hypothetical protein [Tistlia consotensis]|uniref:hypothetical protein n=1 Tax=Tistlia consotensis TaxID=1321365 RepID=UPI0011809C6D|nr:hypothetical protein [Tistlia consotensis]
MGPEISTDDKASVVGVAAHICAASSGGPRYDPNQTPKERASISNAIWLCATCASLVDKNQGVGYSVEDLNRWKTVAEQDAHDALISSSVFETPVWMERLSTVHFANVPRLAHMLPSNAISDRLVRILENGFPTQGMIVRELVAVESAIKSAQLRAIPIDQIMPPTDDIVGALISFHHACFTKNGITERRSTDQSLIMDFDPSKSPHFYIKLGDVKLIFPYDPRWITTSTAHSEFRAGRTKLAGLGVVKRISDDLSEVVISPLVVGLPRHPAWDGLF